MYYRLLSPARAHSFLKHSMIPISAVTCFCESPFTEIVAVSSMPSR